MTHYSVNAIRGPKDQRFEFAASMDWIRTKFPDGKAAETAWLFLSTSGVHGTYGTLDDAEKHGGEPDSITFVVVEPRMVRTCYGQLLVVTQEDRDWLRELVKSSLEMAAASQAGNLPRPRLRSCEVCGGPGPTLNVNSGPNGGRYACRACHPDKDYDWERLG